ncbi:NAD(P)H-dependent glycerol-3-phosphate dehydrogenase [Terribacillus sp. FSL K6-0262]|uniref:NAD(P)H-dependent glycerol-3-phosphate dehydrogenase n=1 Tax=Terribacillus TaxID=459532 RepID=UPI0030ED0506
MTQRITAVLGAGSWGTALAMVLADNGHEVRIWSHNPAQVAAINETRGNEKYLPGVTLPASITAYAAMEDTVKDADAVILVVPAKATREVASKLAAHLPADAVIAHATKGIEPKTSKRVSEMIEEELKAVDHRPVVVLSGPSHAEEVAKRQPTTLSASSVEMEEAKKVQELFMNENFRVYTITDMVGVELGGSLKNIIALGAGISDGLGYGDNAKAALITRGLAEIARLGTKLGANPLTFIGLSGMGDLIVTCTSVHSRNWRTGNMLGKGMSLEEALAQMGMAVEGVRTTEAVAELADKAGVEMPITKGINQILFHGAKAKDIVDQLMTRMPKHEMEDLQDVLNAR